jgi:hypothetical protein
MDTELQSVNSDEVIRKNVSDMMVNSLSVQLSTYSLIFSHKKVSIKEFHHFIPVRIGFLGSAEKLS